MPTVFVLQEGNAAAFVGLGDDGERLVIDADAAEDFENFLDVVAVHFFNAPAERLETVHINRDIVAERSGLALAETVGVHDGNEVVEFVNPSERCGFPHSAFGNFAVAHQHVGVVIEFVETTGKRDAHTNAKPLPQRTRRHIGERQTRRGMTFEIAAKGAQLQEFFGRE